MADQSSPGTVTDSNVIANAVANQGSLADAGDAAFDKKVADEGKTDGDIHGKDDGPDSRGTPPASDTGGKPGDAPAPKTGDDMERGVDDDIPGYYADEGLEEVQTQELQTPQGATDMGQWVLDNLPSISVQGTQNGKAVQINVKRAEDLPADFDFLNKRDEKIFDQNIADQTNRAYRLVEKYQNDQQATQATQFSQQEDRDIQLDIASLQREGLMERFKYPVNDPRFDKDPAVQESQSVLEFYNDQNQARWQESQRTGRLFNRLSYRDAYYLYQREHPPTTPEQKQEDQSRKASSRTIAKAGGGTEQAQSRPKLRRDAGIDEIIAAYGL
jgi:hypothetical protein